MSSSISRSQTPVAQGAQPASLPPAQTFDILPPLHALLSRLVPSSTGGSATLGPLEPHQLSAEASAIKIRVQKARTAVDGLLDIDRSVEEQEEEIKALEERLDQQKKILRELAAVAEDLSSSHKRDETMEDL